MTGTEHFDRCREIMLRHKKHHWIRFSVLLVTLLADLFVQIIGAAKVFEKYVGFHLGTGTIVFTLLAYAFGLMATPERVHFLAALLGVLLFGIWQHFFHPVLGGALVFLYLAEIPECPRALWLKRQQGYPYFNERFEEQLFNGGDYLSDHALDGRAEAVMPEAPGELPSLPEGFQITNSEAKQKGLPEHAMPEIPELPEIPDKGT